MKKILILAALLGAAASASAHTGHGTHSLFEGLAHPLGLDHLLAMVAVGVWSAAALQGARRWLGPAAFLAAMTLGAAAGAAGLGLPGTEGAIALSVAALGALLLAGARLPTAAGLGVVAVAATFHGLAHGAELPAGGTFAAYALGFGVTTTALHVAGLGLGRALRQAQAWVWRTAAGALTAVGLLLLVRA
ncbi:HupE/UreJ family protein [Ideonella livida]|uniref:HupE/UreJ family protein n=1 Tax=Ideonella livida TaxID=2707176 RepID=A0A7C9PFK4_9BURK|nr:HupE/UreJ family protein [Ideonella livida]NDY89814.1 HupE/UreJ family protein [Ideonella livida]